MPDSQRVLERLSQRYEIFIATAAMEFPNSFGPKFRWLERHFPFLSPTRFVFCGDKSILNADYLIDDMPRHFQRFVGQGVLFTAAHNAKVAAPVRVNNWLEVENLFFPR
jgi:5'(3')-deoxyribonucleotidase